MLTQSDRSQRSHTSDMHAKNRSNNKNQKDKSTLLYMLKDFKLKYLLLNQGENHQQMMNRDDTDMEISQVGAQQDIVSSRDNSDL